MPRTNVANKKFNRQRDQRRALLRGLAVSLIEYEAIETTLVKAKALRPYVEKLITKAKKGDLHSRRLVLAQLGNEDATHRLFDEIAPKLAKREGGYLRIERTSRRRGDDALMAEISFVDDLTEKTPAKKPAAKKTEEKKEKSDE